MATNKNGRGLTIVLLSLGGAAVIGGIYLAVKAMKGNKAAGAGNKNIIKQVVDSVKSTVSPNSNNSTGSSNGSGVFPLKKGSNNTTVRELQSALDGHGAGIVIDGIFGDKTEAALKAYNGRTSVGSRAELDAIINSQPFLQPAPPIQPFDYLGLNKQVWN